jgi:hypothetical protein
METVTTVESAVSGLLVTAVESATIQRIGQEAARTAK